MRSRRSRCAMLAAALLVVLVGRGGAPATADDPIHTLLRRLRATDDPLERLRLLEPLAASGVERGASALVDVVLRDPELSVRRAAVTALAGMRLEAAGKMLLSLVGAGGPRQVRETVADVFRTRPGGIAALLGRLQDPAATQVERVLVLEALARYEDDASRAALFERSRDADPAVREAAWRALALRRDAKDARLLLIAQLLRHSLEDGSALEALDAFEPALDASLVPALEHLAASPDAEVQDAAEALLACIPPPPPPAPPVAPGAPAPAPDDRYAKPKQPVDDESVPPPGMARPKYDLVYVCDVTGSTTVTLPLLKQRILDETAAFGRLGASVRVGFVGYRDVDVNRDQLHPEDILLLTLDRARLKAFLARLGAHGIDRNGASLAPALRVSLDRMPWRWRARREVQVLGDDDADDRADAILTVGMHFRADRTRTRVLYVRRTRNSVPPEYFDLAKAGGTVRPELLE